MYPSFMRRVLLACSCVGVGCRDDVKTADYVSPVYDAPCQFAECGPGTCRVTESDTPECLCPVGYDGTHCESCAADFHRDSLGRCVTDQRCADMARNPCAPAGDCMEQDGVIACACDVGYEGPRCTLCADRYARDPLEGCLPVFFTHTEPGPLDAGASDAAMPQPDASAPPVSCLPGYAGPECEMCSEGYHRVAQSCVPDEVCRPTSCPAHAECAVQEGIITCTCQEGYLAPTCVACAQGFHFDNGACLPDETCEGKECPANARCMSDAGRAQCICNAGHQGPTCATCAPGYRMQGGSCVLDGSVCPPGTHSEGEACVADEVCTSTSCPEHASCEVMSGRVACTCDPGWGPEAACNVCSHYVTERSSFEFQEGWPTGTNTCVERRQLAVSQTTFNSRVGTNGPEGPIMLCAPSTYSQMASQHIELEAYAARPASLVFERAASTVVFDCGSRIAPLALDVYAYDSPVADLTTGGRLITSLKLGAQQRRTVTLQLAPEARVVALRSSNGKLQEFALDDLVYTYPDCR